MTASPAPSVLSSSHATLRSLLSQRAFLASLRTQVLASVPRQDADDVLQTSYLAALESPASPEDPAACQAWLRGLIRHKIADYHRHGLEDCAPLPDDAAAPAAPLSARERLRWVEQEVREGRLSPHTLDWMIARVEGQTIDQIGAGEGKAGLAVERAIERAQDDLRTRWKKHTGTKIIVGKRPRETT